MSETEKITAETRTEFGKGAARRIRRDNKIPGVIYGHGAEPLHVTLPGHQTMMALKNGGANALLALDFDGTEHLALTKQVQVDPLRRLIEHIDFVTVIRGERVVVDVAIHVVGDPAPDTLVVTENNTIQVEAEATHIPEFFEVSIHKAPAGTQIHAKDLVLPAGTTLAADEDLLLVNVTGQISAEALEAELAEAEAEAGIEHDAPESETGEDAGEAAAEGDASE
ncbi:MULTISPECIES: 50S ribosomal protein L25/general stress protein Ctc [Nocardioides]|uniref:50S ribosomal protein L25/general stress protein Ctc n=1 Tax=Nocardioides TaxID=1839 RepID=UPI00032F3D69|nr:MULTISPECIES: 50S ribosomal protein L25/general stress protein Ctc [Nocardioides]EON22835.1 50S ribosomal protein L25P [Nocardioides sp. CF8]